MTGVALRWAVLTLLYLVLVGQVVPDEIGLALVCGLTCLAWSLALHQVAHISFHFSTTHMFLVLRAVAEVPRGIAVVVPALLRQRRGHVRDKPVRNAGTSGTDAAWRAVVLLALSLTPDHYALRWTKRGKAVQLHVLAAGTSARQ
jgi:hypothetical protein